MSNGDPIIVRETVQEIIEASALPLQVNVEEKIFQVHSVPSSPPAIRVEPTTNEIKVDPNTVNVIEVLKVGPPGPQGPPGPAGAVDEDSQFEYYPNGDLKKITTPSGTRTFNYDLNGDLINVEGTGIFPNKTLVYSGGELVEIVVG